MAINNAREKPLPNNFRKFEEQDCALIKQGKSRNLLPAQEQGTKPSNALNYELYVQENIENGQLVLRMQASASLFKKKSLGAAFNVYAHGYKKDKVNWAFATSAGQSVSYAWSLDEFEQQSYHLVVHGPNGYYRSYQGDQKSGHILIEQSYRAADEEIVLAIHNRNNGPISLQITDHYQNTDTAPLVIASSKKKEIKIKTKNTYRWYDLEIKNLDAGSPFSRRYAGRIENGKDSITDPLMGA